MRVQDTELAFFSSSERGADQNLILQTEKEKIQILPGIGTILLVVRQFVHRSIAYIQNYNKKLENN
jgi:hypothetical protein